MNRLGTQLRAVVVAFYVTVVVMLPARVAEHRSQPRPQRRIIR
ncbi:hypothetical protein [Actinoplanes sp. NPDC049265]